MTIKKDQVPIRKSMNYIKKRNNKMINKLKKNNKKKRTYQTKKENKGLTKISMNKRVKKTFKIMKKIYPLKNKWLVIKNMSLKIC